MWSMGIWDIRNAKISGKFEGWEVFKYGIKLENERKIGKMGNDNKNKRGNIVEGDKWRAGIQNGITAIFSKSGFFYLQSKAVILPVTELRK